MDNFNLDNHIRKVPDFPKKGILFYDVTSLLTNPDAFGHIVKKMVDRYSNRAISGIVAIESRGFLFAAPLALHLRVPLLLARKKGKLPGKTVSEEYNLEYGTGILEIHSDDLKKDMDLLIIDDLIATGGTLKAVANMIERQGSHVSGIFSVIGLPFLKYEAVLSGYEVTTLINYHAE